MNNKDALKIYAEEATDVFDQVKEEMQWFQAGPQDKVLVQMIEEDLTELEKRSKMIGAEGIGKATRRIHEHLYEMVMEGKPIEVGELRLLMDEIVDVENDLKATFLAS